jgi:glutamate synthase domain-containing protein 3
MTIKDYWGVVVIESDAGNVVVGEWAGEGETGGYLVIYCYYFVKF